MQVIDGRSCKDNSRGNVVRLVSGRRARGAVGIVAVVAAAVLMVLSAGITSTDKHGLFVGWPSQLDIANPRAVVIKSRRSLHLFDGERLIRSYSIALGEQPVGQKVRAGDKRTPEGVFLVCRKNRASKFHRFLGLSYPDANAAARGLSQGLISQGEYNGIIKALAKGHSPSWTTALGGAIGLHGHGVEGDWTAGCVALADDDIEELFRVLRIGDEVEILP